MKYLSLFSGIGGFELGIQQAYVDCTNPRSQRTSKEDAEGVNEDGEGYDPMEQDGAYSEARRDMRDSIECPKGQPTCVGYSEIDKYAVQIYQKHFPEHKNYGDITKIQPSTLPDFDVLVGGFPCQSFSIAGKRGGFNDTRGTLFFEIARILREKQPRFLLLENVKGLLSHDQGLTFLTIISTLDELGYDLQWQVLNSKNFGVPQNRERVFIVGHLRGTSRPQVFPITESNRKNLEQLIGGGQGNRLYSTDGISVTLASQAGGQGAKTGLYAVSNISPREQKWNYENSPTVMARDYKDPKVVKTPLAIRRLTPTECERLQGFPDGWTEGVSDTQRYKCLGNAVTVNVIKEIISRII